MSISVRNRYDVPYQSIPISNCLISQTDISADTNTYRLSACILPLVYIVGRLQGDPLQIVPFSIRGKILNITQIENPFGTYGQ